MTNVAERAEGAERADRADVAKMGNLAYIVFILKVYILKFMLFEVLSCISHVKVYIVAEVYCLYCRPCPAQTDPCQMDRDTQIIQRSLCLIFHLFLSCYTLHVFVYFHLSNVRVLFCTCQMDINTEYMYIVQCTRTFLFFTGCFPRDFQHHNQKRVAVNKRFSQC